MKLLGEEVIGEEVIGEECPFCGYEYKKNTNYCYHCKHYEARWEHTREAPNLDDYDESGNLMYDYLRCRIERNG